MSGSFLWKLVDLSMFVGSCLSTPSGSCLLVRVFYFVCRFVFVG